MSKNDPIMQRMKENYEKRSRHYLTRRMPVILRLDGKAFHTYTRGLNKPFDEDLIHHMVATAIHLCENIQGAKCGYVQSDEISILLTDYDKLNTDAWFDYGVQKMCSISASMSASYFNHLRLAKELSKRLESGDSGHDVAVYGMSKRLLANFDCRAFNIPKEEVANYFVARQRDATKNSVSMLAQSLCSHKEVHKKNDSEMQELCFQKGHNWNDLHYSKKRGTFVIKNLYINDVRLGNGVFTDDEPNTYIDSNGPIKNPTIRTKWEAVETPMSFNNTHFEQWL